MSPTRSCIKQGFTCKLLRNSSQKGLERERYLVVSTRGERERYFVLDKGSVERILERQFGVTWRPSQTSQASSECEPFELLVDTRGVEIEV